jgi:ATP-dependent helicase HrpA
MSAATYVAGQMNTEIGGDVIGYCTALSRKISKNTRCPFATDGLQLVRELTLSKQTLSTGVVLIIDEIHEWNLNIETLVAWVRTRIDEGSSVKVVLMSATMETEKLSAFFENAPVISVPGRCFSVDGSPDTGIRQVGAGALIDEIKTSVQSGNNTLVFVPGKSDISSIQEELEKLSLQAIILPLHAELEPSEQQKVFKKYLLPKVIISTNVAQTSVTIPDIDMVIDTGLENRKELVGNVETIILGTISKADCKQRAGRAGRTKSGEYVLCNDTPYEDFNEYPVPEIKRCLLDQMVLRLAGANMDATTLQFYHQPDTRTLLEAKKTLIALGALNQNGKITELGKKINQFPIDVVSAKMVLAAADYHCLDSVIKIAAIRNSRGGTLKRRPKSDDPIFWKKWEDLVNPLKKYPSDYLLELDLFNLAEKMNPNSLNRNGLSYMSFCQTREIVNQIHRVVKDLGYRIPKDKEGIKNDESVCKAIISGMIHQVYKRPGYSSFVSIEQKQGFFPEIRQLFFGSRADVSPHRLDVKLVAAQPMNIKTKVGGHIILLIKNITIIKPEWVDELGLDREKCGLPPVLTEVMPRSTVTVFAG